MKLHSLQKVFLAMFLVFASVLSVSGTIALRNVLHVLLLVQLMVALWCWGRREFKEVARSAQAIPLSVWLWCSYLIVFPWIAPDSSGAWENLLGKGMWGESILTWLLAWGAFLILGYERLTLWVLTLVSAVPVFIHLVLTLLAWGGVLQPAFYADPSLQQAVLSLGQVITDPSQIQNPFASFPMGFRGIEPMHGNLGYPASQAMCLGLAAVFSGLHRGDSARAVKAGGVVTLCFVSVVIAQSRAAAYFGVLIITLAGLAYSVRIRFHGSRDRRIPAQLGRRAGMIVLGTLSLCLAFFWKVTTQNSVWYSMWDKMAIGFQVDSPEKLICEGLGPSTYEFVRQKAIHEDPAYVETLVDGLRGDGGRVLLAKVGAELSARFPWGWNGGRDAYQHRIEQLCGHTPAMDFSHAHNAWINLTLALGWAGTVLYAWILVGFAKIGWDAIKKQNEWPTALALALLSVFWFMRGMVDAVYQEHYLQMQATLLLLLVLQIRLGKPARELRVALS